MAGRGYNTFHGYDDGPPPPGMNSGQPQYTSYYQPQYTFPVVQPVTQPVVYQQPVLPVASGPIPAYFQGYPGFPVYPGFPGHSSIFPSGHPTADGSFPGIHLRNDTGGVGLPPGYDYAFPQEHTKIHVFKTKDKPWQTTIWTQDASTHIKLLVPVTTKIKELMQNVGCTNEDAKKNILYECVEKGNGQWSAGLKICGDDKDRVKKAISEYGWDKTRTGHPGGKPVVWLWVTKEGQ